MRGKSREWYDGVLYWKLLQNNGKVFSSLLSEIIHKQEIFELDMPYYAGWIVNVVAGYDDLLGQVVDAIEGFEFSLVGFFLHEAVCNLHKIGFAIFAGAKINFLASIDIHMEFVASEDEFVVDYVFKVVSQIIALVLHFDWIQGNILVIKFDMEFQFLFGFLRVLP